MNKKSVAPIVASVFAIFAVMLFFIGGSKNKIDGEVDAIKVARHSEASLVSKNIAADESGATSVYGLRGASGSPSVQEIQSLADSGNSAAQRVLSEIYADCQMYSVDHDAFVALVRSYWKTPSAAPPKVEKFLNDLMEICDQVDGGEMIPANAASEWRIQAAANGDRIAQAHDVVMRFDQLDMSHVQNVVNSVIRDGNPDQLLAISEVMWRPIPLGDSYDPALSGSPLAAQSWAIAACRRGAQCGPLSRAMRFFCLMNGVCESSSYEDFIFSHLVSPADRAKVERLIGEVNHTLDMHGG